MEPSASSRGNYKQLNILTRLQDPLAPTALSAMMELILENQRLMLDTQNEILHKINEYSVKLNELSAVRRQSESQSFPVSANPENFFTPIDSAQELEDFEQDLKDPEKNKALYEKFVSVCEGTGVNAPYFLIDTMFTRLFMTKCSWCGGSRGEESKVPFKIYTNTIRFYQQVVYSCDNTFSMVECHKFLKIVLKNSVKRYESKGMRSAHRKRRRKYLHYLNNMNSGDEYDESAECAEPVVEAEMSDGEMDEDKE